MLRDVFFDRSVESTASSPASGNDASATMSVLAGATFRLPILFPIFGTTGWEGMFGPIFLLGAVLVVARSVMLRKLDSWLAGGFAAMVVSYVVAVHFATSDA